MIKNIDELSITDIRGKLLEILDYGLEQTTAQKALENQIKLKDSMLSIQGKDYNLDKYKKIIVLGIGKASVDACNFLENLLGDQIDSGYCIDVVAGTFDKIESIAGTHPFTSATNINFTKKIMDAVSGLSEDDLVINIISGGGSALFSYPYVELDEVNQIFETLTKGGASIHELNIVRKHISHVKGGGLAKSIYPATCIGLIFSDVPGNDLHTIASGPTVKDNTNINDAEDVLKKYKIKYSGNLTETPKEEKYYENISNFIVVSNKNTLNAMEKKATELGIDATIVEEDIEVNANDLGKFLLEKTHKGELLLAAGETTVKITGKGKGGRNQQSALAALLHISDGDVIISCASDGQDYTEMAGGIADKETIDHAKTNELDIEEYLDNNNSFTFFEKSGDQIYTGKTGLNVSDIFLCYKA